MKKVKKKFFEQKEKMLKKLPSPLGIDQMLHQMAEVIYHSYFKKYPHELEKIKVPQDNDFFKAA
ncbi:MAG: hypothetical protein ACK40M_06330 [Flavobacteriales bacterium]